MTTQTEIRESFWEFLPGTYSHTQNGKRKTQNDYPCEVRSAFVDYVDMLARSGEISESLASRVTL